MIEGDLSPRFAAFVRATFGRRAHALGTAEKKGEPLDARALRPVLLRVVADEGGDASLRGDARKLALRWLSDHSGASPELAAAALQVAAIDGDAALYDRYLAAAKAERNRVDRQRILDGLGRFRNPELVARGFKIYLSEDFDPRESFALVAGPASYFGTRELALDFTEKNFDAIVDRMPRDFGAYLPRIGANFCDDEHAAAMETFFGARVRRFAGGDRRLAQTLEEIHQCAAFRAKGQPSLAAFLSH
jgi:alanyl aminopeptidase